MTHTLAYNITPKAHRSEIGLPRRNTLNLHIIKSNSGYKNITVTLCYESYYRKRVIPINKDSCTDTNFVRTIAVGGLSKNNKKWLPELAVQFFSSWEHIIFNKLMSDTKIQASSHANEILCKGIFWNQSVKLFCPQNF